MTRLVVSNQTLNPELVYTYLSHPDRGIYNHNHPAQAFSLGAIAQLLYQRHLPPTPTGLAS